jgi:ribonuclease E
MLNFYNKKAVERKLREKLKDDRARITFGRISNFGLLEMTRQRLRESSVKWNMVLSLDSFALKVIKKAEEAAFLNKAKIININIPQKVKNFIEKNISKEINFFKKKYKIEFNITADPSLILPEYRIDLFNKNKKLLNKIENIEEAEIKPNRPDYNKNHFGKNRYNYKKKFNKRNKFKKRGSFGLKMKKGDSENKKLFT